MICQPLFFVCLITHLVLNFCPMFQYDPYPFKCFILVLVLLSFCQKGPCHDCLTEKKLWKSLKYGDIFYTNLKV